MVNNYFIQKHYNSATKKYDEFDLLEIIGVFVHKGNVYLNYKGVTVNVSYEDCIKMCEIDKCDFTVCCIEGNMLADNLCGYGVFAVEEDNILLKEDRLAL